MTRSEIDCKFPGLLSHTCEHQIPGLESYEQLGQRVKKTIESIAKRHPGKKILIVTHGGTINAFLHAVTGKREDRIGNTAITRIRYDNEIWYVDCINDCFHLGE
jgi:broad specificity phosphatase PhoE